MRYPKEAVVFEVLDDNGAPLAVGSVVEFVEYADEATILAVDAFGDARLTELAPCDVAAAWRSSDWYYGRRELRPLTSSAKKVLNGLAFA